MSQRRIIVAGLLAFAAIAYIVEATDTIAAWFESGPSSQLFWLSIALGPFWNALRLVPVTIVAAFLISRVWPFVATITVLQLISIIAWYHATGEWRFDVEEGGQFVVAAISVLAIAVQVPLFVVASHLVRRRRPDDASDHTVRAISKVALVNSYVILALVAAGFTAYVVRITWPHNILASAAFVVHPTPAPMPRVVQSVPYRPVALAHDDGHLFVASDSWQAVVTYKTASDGALRQERLLYGPRTKIKEPLALAIDGHGHLYVANYAANGICVFDERAAGDASPLSCIRGPHTLLDGPFALQFDDSGDLYVLEGASTGIGVVLVFSPGARGDATPARIIRGPRTMLSFSGPMVVTKSGTVLIGNGHFGPNPSPPAGAYITIFGPSARGNIAPLSVVPLGGAGRDFTLDESEQLLVVGDDGIVHVYRAPYESQAFSYAGATSEVVNPQGWLVAGGRLYTADLQTDRLYSFALRR
jgi:hypothetical protein